MKRAILMLISVFALFFLCGCNNQVGEEAINASKTLSCSGPYILYDQSCCLDMDGNGICDSFEKTTEESTSTTLTTLAAESDTAPARINESINKAVEFLYLNQLENGEFKTYASKDPMMRSASFDSSPFITPFVLYSIKDVKNPKVPGIVNRGLDFLLSEQRPGGVWSYWTKRNGKSIDIDIDDISMISYILKKNNKGFEDNKKLILSNKNQENLFLTWIRQNGEKNDVDCVLNANVLFYLDENDPPVCSYINRVVKTDQECSVYYPDRLILFYVVSRNLKEGLACFEESREKMISSTLALSKTDGSFGDDLDTALALNILLNCGYEGSAVDNGIKHLMEKQATEGSWPKAPFFIGSPTYYGSEEFTTGIAIEALEKYLEHTTKK